MGSLILCHKKKAKQPYEIARVHRKIYTIEELCYYLSHNLYLIDHTVMNRQLCDWMEEELELTELADKLKQLIKQQASVEQFVLTILSYVSIYTTGELKQIQDVLQKLKNQNPMEKQKYKADNLLESGAIQSAILIYQSIVNGEPDESVDRKFYGRVYGCLGAAYGRLFLYEQAAKMYEKAYDICGEQSMLKAYLYACRKYMPAQEYNRLLSKSSMYQQTDSGIYWEMSEVAANVPYKIGIEMLYDWKTKYRKMGTGEG